VREAQQLISADESLRDIKTNKRDALIERTRQRELTCQSSCTRYIKPFTS
jgi:hypothetical protein